MAVDGATLRYIVYDILRDFKQRLPDAEISEYQLTYWVMVHADRLKKLHIQKIDSGEYVHKFDVALVKDSDDRMYIPLPGRIYDYDLDKGIAYICYIATEVAPGQDDVPGFTVITFSRTTPGAARVTYFREEEEPSLANPYFYRMNDDIFFLGLEDATMPRDIELGLYNTLDPTDLTLDIDQPFDFPQDLIPILKRQVLDLGLWALNVPRDLINDGTDGQAEVQQKKFISVNELNQEQP